MYARIINEILVELRRTDVKACHVEALMRVQHRTLDHLRRPEFKECVRASVLACGVMSEDELDDTARSYGVRVPDRRPQLRLV